ncbi:MAG: hypothetical protein QOG89_442 [Thermomicrobiales bacterium]|nr:hypothetical protein [Thermomicrobiales bacterium]
MNFNAMPDSPIQRLERVAKPAEPVGAASSTSFRHTKGEWGMGQRLLLPAIRQWVVGLVFVLLLTFIAFTAAAPTGADDEPPPDTNAWTGDAPPRSLSSPDESISEEDSNGNSDGELPIPSGSTAASGDSSEWEPSAPVEIEPDQPIQSNPDSINAGQHETAGGAPVDPGLGAAQGDAGEESVESVIDEDGQAATNGDGTRSYLNRSRVVDEAQDEQGSILKITLQEIASSGLSGTATLVGNGETTSVLLEVTGDATDTTVGIYSEHCDGHRRDLVLSLEEPDDTGRSETTLAARLSQLFAGPHAVVVYRQTGNASVEAACGDIAVGSDAITDTGVGTMAATRQGSQTTIVLAGLAILLLCTGLVIRRRPYWFDR